VGEATKTITVLVNGDTTVEPHETLFVNLSNARGATITDGEGQGTIQNDDAAPPPPPPTLAINSVSRDEGNAGTTAFEFTVTKSTTDEAATVEFATANGTASETGDYAAQSGTLSFAPGEATKTITIQVNGDPVFESDETFFVFLANASNATIVEGAGKGTIENDDEAPRLVINDISKAEGQAGSTAFAFTVTKSGATEVPASVEFDTENGTATAPRDYSAHSDTITFAPGRSRRTITVWVDGDLAREPDETFRLVLSNAGGATIADGEGRGTIENDDRGRGDSLPNLTGRTLAQARRLLVSRGYALGRVTRAYSSKIRKGRIIRQSRRRGIRALRGTRVNVVVSRGRRR
jgi:hypothetical protein